MTPPDIVNFFDLLGLDPDAPWDQARFETALKQKQGDWSRNKVMGVGRKKAEAEAAYRLIPAIRDALTDPTQRDVHARRARTARVTDLERHGRELEAIVAQRIEPPQVAGSIEPSDVTRLSTLLGQALHIIDKYKPREIELGDVLPPPAVATPPESRAAATRPRRESSVALGIDFGTTYSCIATVDEHGKPQVIPNREGSLTTPCVVLFDGDNRVVGSEAKDAAFSQPRQVVALVRRQLGSTTKPLWRFSYDGQDYTPEEIASYVLQRLVKDAEDHLRFPIKDVVITCPAYFGVGERDALGRSAELAGLNLLGIVNEQMAAAVAYSLLDSMDRAVLVYALGGCTFDLAMVEIKGGNLTLVATHGDPNLGGRQWDERLVQHLVDRWQAEFGSSEDPLDSLETVQHLFDRAERVKWSLSRRDKTEIAVQHAGKRIAVTVTRERFDELTADLREATIQRTHDMLERVAAKGFLKMDEILLVGGSTRMTQIQERVRTEFAVPVRCFDPDHAVAKGAALYAAKLSGVRARL